jgi:hypothetical protein
MHPAFRIQILPAGYIYRYFLDSSFPLYLYSACDRETLSVFIPKLEVNEMRNKALVALMAAAFGIGMIDLVTLGTAFGQTKKATSSDADQIRPQAKKAQGQSQTKQASGSTTTKAQSTGQVTKAPAKAKTQVKSTGQTQKATSYDADQIRPKAKKTQGQSQATTTKSSPGSRSSDLGSWGQDLGAASDAQSEYSQAQAMTNSVGGAGGTMHLVPRHK